MSCFVTAILFVSIYGCNKSKNSFPASTSNQQADLNVSNVSSTEFQTLTDSAKVEVLKRDPDFQLIAKFQRKFIDKIMSSNVDS